MVAEFMEFETPNEPQMGTVSSIQDKYSSMMLDLNDDLQDEIGTRREQFDSLSETCDNVLSYVKNVDMESSCHAERNLKLAVVGITIGVVSICLNALTILFL